jgi:hypothetical protein
MANVKRKSKKYNQQVTARRFVVYGLILFLAGIGGTIEVKPFIDQRPLYPAYLYFGLVSAVSLCLGVGALLLLLAFISALDLRFRKLEAILASLSDNQIKMGFALIAFLLLLIGFLLSSHFIGYIFVFLGCGIIYIFFLNS